MRLRNCFGTIWSVSTLTRGRAATRPACRMKASCPPPDVDEVPGDAGGGGHGGTHQVGAATAPLAALEVAVLRRRAALAARQDVRVHAEAHRAPRIAPLEPRLPEHPVQSLGFGLCLDLLRPRHDQGAHARRPAPPCRGPTPRFPTPGPAGARARLTGGTRGLVRPPAPPPPAAPAAGGG